MFILNRNISPINNYKFSAWIFTNISILTIIFLRFGKNLKINISDEKTCSKSSINLLLTVYNSLTVPHKKYTLTFWESNITDICKLQKTVTKIILKKNKQD